MLGRFPNLLLAASLLAITLAGCADAPAAESDDPFTGTDKEIEATSTTGGIRGVVVDEAIIPIPDATITLIGSETTTTSDENGLFVIDGLEPGFYQLEATAVFYDTIQTAAEVVAGVSDPDALRMQLTRTVFDVPNSYTLKFDGFIYCSANVVGAYSEECGEGVGYPCNIPPTLWGCNDRIGKNEQNVAGTEWYLENDAIETMIVEQVWKPTVQASADNSGQFRTFVSVNWVCDPWCGEDHEFNGGSGTVASSPLRVEVDMAEHKEALMAMDPPLGPDMRMTTFTYAADNPGLLLQQPYESFTSVFYVLPAPEEWSFVNGDDHPLF